MNTIDTDLLTGNVIEYINTLPLEYLKNVPSISYY